MFNRLSATAIAAASLCLSTSAFAAGELLIKIGHVAPLSGAQAAFGKDNENGARMAIADLNAKGIKIGGKTAKFELVAEDDAADAKQGAAVAQRFCDMKVNAVVGHLNSGTTIPASKLYHACGLPMITPASTNPDLTKPGYANVFRLIASDSALGAGLADFAAKQLKAKRVAIIDDRTAYGQGIATVFKNTAKQKGLQIVAEDFTNDKAVDFLAILTSIKAKNLMSSSLAAWTHKLAPCCAKWRNWVCSTPNSWAAMACVPKNWWSKRPKRRLWLMCIAARVAAPSPKPRMAKHGRRAMTPNIQANTSFTHPMCMTRPWCLPMPCSARAVPIPRFICPLLAKPNTKA